MKKLGKILCAVILATSMLLASVPVFAAGETASQSTDAYKIYLSASQRMQKAKSLVMTGNLKTGTTIGEYIYPESVLKFEGRTLYNDKKELQAQMISSDDRGFNAVEYYKDGYLYSNNNGKKTKTKASDEEVFADTCLINPNLPKELFENATVEAVEGGKRIKMVLPAKSLNDLIGGFYDELTAGIQDAGNLKFSKVLVYITIGGDGNIKSCRVVFDMTMAYKEVFDETKIRMSISMNIVSINELTKINFPGDLSSYTKV